MKTTKDIVAEPAVDSASNLVILNAGFRSGTSSFLSIDKNIKTYCQQLTFKRFSPILELFNLKIIKLHESGLIEKWLRRNKTENKILEELMIPSWNQISGLPRSNGAWHDCFYCRGCKQAKSYLKVLQRSNKP